MADQPSSKKSHEYMLKVRLRPRMKRELMALAELEGTSMSAITKEALTALLRDRNPVQLTTARPSAALSR